MSVPKYITNYCILAPKMVYYMGEFLYPLLDYKPCVYLEKHNVNTQ